MAFVQLDWRRTNRLQEIIWNNAQTIAASYPQANRSIYLAAAVTLRLPYWDWASDAAMPDLLNTKTIVINTPSGSQNITNPLYTYTFHPRPNSSDFPPGEIVSTSRRISRMRVTLQC